MTTLKKMNDITIRRVRLIAKLVAPARAAANQMTDAGMKSGADPLLEVLFELDALDAEVAAFVAEDPLAIMEALIEIVEDDRP